MTSCKLFPLDQTAGVEANDMQTDKIIEILANDEDKQLVRSPVLQYEDWLPVWGELTASAPKKPYVRMYVHTGHSMCYFFTTALSQLSVGHIPEQSPISLYKASHRDSELVFHVTHKPLRLLSAIWKEH